MNDHQPGQCAVDTIRASHIAKDYRAEAARDSRLPVTHARRGKAGQVFAGHIALRERILQNHFRRVPNFLPHESDDLGMYISLLLAQMPLQERIYPVYSSKERRWKLPNTTAPVNFHRRYSKELLPQLRDRPELRRWRLVFMVFLQKKLPEGRQNEFKWQGFHMSPVEIEQVVTVTTYQFGMQRMGYP